MKVYIAVKLHKDAPPTLIDVYASKKEAEKVAYSGDEWGNVIEAVVK